jgi:hypothetical protein
MTDAIRLAAVLATDDDNQPAPKNIPQVDQPPLPQGTWGHNNICDRKATGVPNAHASVCVRGEFSVSLFRLLELSFCKSFAIEVLLPVIKRNIVPGQVVTYGKFLRWIGLWLFTMTIQGPMRREYWSNEPIPRFKGTPCHLGDLMSRKQFEVILYSIR